MCDFQGVQARNDYREKTIEPGGNKVLFGDSQIAIMDMTNLFGAENVINRGVPGSTALGSRDRLTTVLSESPSRIAIEFGFNDIFAGRNFYQITSDVQFLADQAKASGCSVTICTPLPVTKNVSSVIPKDWIAFLSVLLFNMAVTKGYDFCNFFYALGGSDGYMSESLTCDSLHPNEAGTTVMRQVLAQYGGF